MRHGIMFALKSLLLFFLAAVLVGVGGLGGYFTARNSVITLLKLQLYNSHIPYPLILFCLGHCAHLLIFHVKWYE